MWVAVYPISGDGEAVTANYIDWPSDLTFRPIEEFIATEAGAHSLAIDPGLRRSQRYHVPSCASCPSW